MHERIARCVSQNETELDVSGVRLDEAAVKSMGMKKLVHVKSLRAGQCDSGPAVSLSFFVVVQRMSVLTALDVCGNRLGLHGALAMARMLPELSKTLATLNISDNQLAGVNQFGEGKHILTGVVAIAEALQSNEVITSLDVSSNQLYFSGNIEGVLAIRQLCIASPALSSVTFSGDCRCTRDGRRSKPFTVAISAQVQNAAVSRFIVERHRSQGSWLACPCPGETGQ